jgi:trans-aconitate 2-methyltransferase
MTLKPIEWDAAAYDKLSDPQFSWGMKLLATLPLRGDETVLDAGCGSGRLTSAWSFSAAILRTST